MQLHITLTGQLESKLLNAVKDGMYGTKSELIRSAIRNELKGLEGNDRT